MANEGLTSESTKEKTCSHCGGDGWICDLKMLKEKMTQKYNPPKSNMSTKNQWLEDVFPIETVPFKGTC